MGLLAVPDWATVVDWVIKGARKATEENSEMPMDSDGSAEGDTKM